MLFVQDGKKKDPLSLILPGNCFLVVVFYYVYPDAIPLVSHQEYCTDWVVLLRELLVDFSCCCHFAVNSGSCGALLQLCSIVRYVALPFYEDI